MFESVVDGHCKFIREFVEGEGQLLAWSAFLLLRAAPIPEAIRYLTWPMFGLIMVSLFIVRPVAIWVSLIRTDALPLTCVFFGWFGPRGLATALFALLVVDMVPTELRDTILHIAVNTVWLSALLHGITAASAASWYGRMVNTMGSCPETEPMNHRGIPATP